MSRLLILAVFSCLVASACVEDDVYEVESGDRSDAVNAPLGARCDNHGQCGGELHCVIDTSRKTRCQPAGAREALETLAQGRDCQYCVLSGAYLHNADLSGVDLTGAILNQANLNHADFRGANIEDTILVSARVYKVQCDSSTTLPKALAFEDGWICHEGYLFNTN